MTNADRGKIAKIEELMSQETAEAYNAEDEALELAHLIVSYQGRRKALKKIADRMCTA